MSWKYHKETVEGIRKVKWDGLWHVMYSCPHHYDSSREIETYDRVDKRTAMYVAKNMDKWRKE